MHYVYILQSENNGKRYIGSTSDLKKRFDEHQKGRVQSTKSLLPLKLVYYECFSLKRDALREELFLKTGKGRERIKYLFDN